MKLPHRRQFLHLAVLCYIGVRDRKSKRIGEHRHCLFERDAVLGGVAGRLRRVPVEVDAHGSQLSPEGKMLERGEKCVELYLVEVQVITVDVRDPEIWNSQWKLRTGTRY